MRGTLADYTGSVSEHDLTVAIRQLLKIYGIFHWKVHQSLGCTPGVPDILGIYKGKMLGIEVKTKNGKVSPAQQGFIDAINREGGLVFVARSVDDVMEKLELGVRSQYPKKGE